MIFDVSEKTKLTAKLIEGQPIQTVQFTSPSIPFGQRVVGATNLVIRGNNTGDFVFGTEWFDPEYGDADVGVVSLSKTSGQSERFTTVGYLGLGAKTKIAGVEFLRSKTLIDGEIAEIAGAVVLTCTSGQKLLIEAGSDVTREVLLASDPSYVNRRITAIKSEVCPLGTEHWLS